MQSQLHIIRHSSTRKSQNLIELRLTVSGIYSNSLNAKRRQGDRKILREISVKKLKNFPKVTRLWKIFQKKRRETWTFTKIRWKVHEEGEEEMEFLLRIHFHKSATFNLNNELVDYKICINDQFLNFTFLLYPGYYLPSDFTSRFFIYLLLIFI